MAYHQPEVDEPFDDEAEDDMVVQKEWSRTESGIRKVQNFILLRFPFEFFLFFYLELLKKLESRFLKSNLITTIRVSLREEVSLETGILILISKIFFVHVAVFTGTGSAALRSHAVYLLTDLLPTRSECRTGGNATRGI